MSNNGGMLDTYLLAQALGWEWNLGTIILIDVILLLIFFAFIIGIGILCMWLDNQI